ncbi:hypothetical protein NVV94_19985 [Pseudomonas sp. LS1212]|uniref:hypothetical protein n=1 Tax=Pseudomonas sp. LS1212 TaxID=2972478 RepID=UPI00215BA05F|nr:hypothetical protein [Pseudomonas sp. LS1212]UVJ42854.1 hypothetical protein NVV94_19985 [Pseudomonas sp. LS1212]
MDNAMTIKLLVAGVALVVLSILMRVRTVGKYEVKTLDLVFLIVPLMVWSLATGNLKDIDLFGVKVNLSEQLVNAANTGIEGHVLHNSEQLNVKNAEEVMKNGGKVGSEELRELKERCIKDLEFKLGHDGYTGPAIKAYFEALYGSSYLRVVVVNEPNSKLFGTYKATSLIDYLRLAGDSGYVQFQQRLKSNSEADRAQLSKLPGFVGVDMAVTNITSKRDALARMEDLDIERLPVVNEDKFFMGTVGRARLTTGLILAATDKQEKQSSAKAGAQSHNPCPPPLVRHSPGGLDMNFVDKARPLSRKGLAQ